MSSLPPFIVGITGGSASGKTHFLQSLLSAFQPEEITLISQDNYYRELMFIPRDENGIHNFDLPETIDHIRFSEHIWQLHERQTVTTQEYTFNNPHVTPRLLTYLPTPIIVVEGIFVFYFEDIYKQLDLKVFIDSKNKVKLERRIVRDQHERNIPLETILYQWDNHVRPTYQKYIKPFKAQADVVIPNNERYTHGLQMLICYLQEQMRLRRPV